MIDLTGTSIEASEDAGRAPCLKFELYLGGSWVDYSSIVETATVSTSAGANLLDFGQSAAGRLTLQMKSDDGLLATELYGTRARLYLGFYNASNVPEYVRVFTGNVLSLTSSAPRQLMTMTCADRSFVLVDRMVRTAAYEDQRTSDMAEVIRQLVPAEVRPVRGTWQDGYLRIPYAWLDDDKAWADLRQLAEAEMGAVRCDYLGQLCFYNAGHIFEPSSPITLTSTEASVVDNVLEWGSRAQYIRVSYRPIVKRLECEVYKQREDELLQPGESRIHLAQYQYPAVDAAVSDVKARTLSGLDAAADLQYTANYYAQMAEITLINLGTRPIVVSDLTIRGKGLLVGNERVIIAKVSGSDVVFTSDIGGDAVSPPQEVRGNWYIQTRAAAEWVAAAQAWRARSTPRRIVLNDLGGKFWVEPMDHVTLDGELAIVRQVTITYNKRITVQAELYRLSDFAPLAENFFRLGTDALGGTRRYFL